MRKKILFCASTVSHILNFHLPYLRAFHEMGYEVWVAADRQASVPYADRVVALPMQKKFLSFGNLKAVLEARRLVREQRFDMVSTHTGLASAVVRAAILLLHERPNVVCTVHGYLFREDEGLKKWIYLIPEKLCARVTDVLMVMNHEDYEIARKHKLYRDKLSYINGMGLDLAKFRPATPEERFSARKKFRIGENDFVYVYAAEFSRRKNQAFLIRAFAEVCRKNPRMKLLLAGNGVLLEECRTLAHQLHADGQILFPGYVEDMQQLYAASDVCVSVSRIEGLPFNVMEAMACGLPVVASDIKGHRELIEDGENGALFQTEDSASLERGLRAVLDHPGIFSEKRDLSRFGIEAVLPQIVRIYREVGA